MIEESQVIQLNRGIAEQAFGLEMLIADDSNHIYVIWTAQVENASDLFRLYLSQSRDNGTTFNTPVAIGNSTAFHDVQVATQGAQNVYATWHDQDKVFFARSNDSGGTFSVPITLDSSSRSASNLKLASTGSSVFAAWQEKTSDQGEGRIFFTASHDNGTTFGDAINLNNIIADNPSNSIFNARLPIIAAASSSSNQSLLLISWTEYYAESDSVGPKLIYSTDGGKTFEPSSLASDANDDNNNTYLIQAMQSQDDDHHIYLVLADDESLFLARSNFDDGGKPAFTEPVKFAQNNASSSFGFPPQVIKTLFEGDDNIYVLYSGERFEGANYYFTKSEDGGKSFSEPLKLFGYGTYYPDMAVNGENVYIIRTDAAVHLVSRPATTMHLLVSTDSGNTFEKAHDFNAEQNSTTISSPNIKSMKEHDSDEIYLLWNEGSRNESKVFFAKLKVGSEHNSASPNQQFTPIPSAPKLDSALEQKLSEIALNVEGIKEWSPVGWQVQSIDFAGTTEPELKWNGAVVWLKLPAEVAAPAYCDLGWVAMVVINLETMQVESADYPRRNGSSDAICRGIGFEGLGM